MHRQPYSHTTRIQILKQTKTKTENLLLWRVHSIYFRSLPHSQTILVALILQSLSIYTIVICTNSVVQMIKLISISFFLFISELLLLPLQPALCNACVYVRHSFTHCSAQCERIPTLLFLHFGAVFRECEKFGRKTPLKCHFNQYHTNYKMVCGLHFECCSLCFWNNFNQSTAATLHKQMTMFAFGWPNRKIFILVTIVLPFWMFMQERSQLPYNVDRTYKEPMSLYLFYF